MLEILFEVIGEFLLQLLLELLAEFGLHSILVSSRKALSPWLAALAYGFFGAVVGWLSLLVFPSYLVGNHSFQIANLIITPIAVGLAMCAVGGWRMRLGKPLLRIDRFGYGYGFALSLALVRYVFSQ